MDDAAFTPDAETPATTLSQAELDVLTDQLIEALKSVFDPEIPVDIYELGLIYKVDISDDKFVTVDMTLTAPACPVAGEMPSWVENAVATVGGVSGSKAWASIRRSGIRVSHAPSRCANTHKREVQPEGSYLLGAVDTCN